MSEFMKVEGNDGSMIVVDGNLCYSPLPPEKYGRGPLGHGPFCKQDLQQWNLIFLSCPAVDRYLEPGADAWEIVNSIPSYILANAMAALGGLNCQRLFPDLRQALKLPPLQFVEEVRHMNYECMPMYLSDPSWIDTISARADGINRAQEELAWEKTRAILTAAKRKPNA